MGLTLREKDALYRVWDRQNKVTEAMYFQLRADIHNSSKNLNRQDERRWNAQDFGAPERAEDPRRGKIVEPKKIQKAKLITTFGIGNNGSVLANLKGQSISADAQTKIAEGKLKPAKRRTRNLRPIRMG